MPFQPWKRSHPWVSLKFCKDSQKSVITSVLLTTLWPHWRHQTTVQDGWGQVLQEFQCTTWVLMANNSMCHKAWKILWLKGIFSVNPPETWTARGYLGCCPVFHWALYVAAQWMEVSELLFQSWCWVLLWDFSHAMQRSEYLSGCILGGSTGSVYIFVSKKVRKIIICSNWDRTARECLRNPDI